MKLKLTKTKHRLETKIQRKKRKTLFHRIVLYEEKYNEIPSFVSFFFVNVI
jgi:hypothetical protein